MSERSQMEQFEFDALAEADRRAKSNREALLVPIFEHFRQKYQHRLDEHGVTFGMDVRVNSASSASTSSHVQCAIVAIGAPYSIGDHICWHS